MMVRVWVRDAGFTCNWQFTCGLGMRKARLRGSGLVGIGLFSI